MQKRKHDEFCLKKITTPNLVSFRKGTSWEPPGRWESKNVERVFLHEMPYSGLPTVVRKVPIPT